jgi:hypothetical protein
MSSAGRLRTISGLVAGEDRLEARRGRQMPEPHGGVDIVVLSMLELLENAVHGFFGEFVSFLTENFLDHGLAEGRHILVALLVRMKRRMRARALPVTTKRFPVGDGVCALEVMISTWSPFCEHGAQRHDAAVDLGADAMVADRRVHRVGEVDRRCAARHFDQVALGREAEDLVLEHLELGVLEESSGLEACSRMSSSSRSQRYCGLNIGAALPCL